MTPDLFNRIASALAVPPGRPDHIQGWCDIDKACDLASTVLALRPTVIVEIGVFGGRSLIPLALACQHLGRGVVIGIDPWSPAASTAGYDEQNAKWWGELNHEEIYQSFMGHVRRLNLQGHVVVERKPSDEVSLDKTPADFLHLDGQHTEQAIRDVNRFAVNVRNGGFCCVDDTGWTNHGIAHVSMAVDALLKLGFVHLYNVGTGAMFQRYFK